MGSINPGKVSFSQFARGDLGWIDPGISYFSQFARGANDRINPGKASFSPFTRGAIGMTDPGKPSFLPFARDAGGKLDPGIFTFSPFARVNSKKSSVNLARTLSIAAPPTAFSASLLPQPRRQRHSQRRSFRNRAASSILSGAPSATAPPTAFSAALLPQLCRQQHSQRRTAFSSIGSGTNDSGKRIRQVLARVQYSKCPWQIVFFVIYQGSLGWFASGIFPFLPFAGARGGMTDPCNCLFSHFARGTGDIFNPNKTRPFSTLTTQKPLESLDSSGIRGSCHRGFEPRASTSGEWRASTALMAHDSLQYVLPVVPF